MTTTLVQANAENTRLELVIEPGQGPKMRLIDADEKLVRYWRYEYWEVSRALSDYDALVKFMIPGEGTDEEALSGDAAGEQTGGSGDGNGAGRLLHPSAAQHGREGEGAESGAA